MIFKLALLIYTHGFGQRLKNVILHPKTEIVSYNLIMEFVKSGFGIEYATKEFIKEELTNKQLYEIEIIPQVSNKCIGIVTLSQAVPNYSAKKLIDIILKYE